MGKKRRRRGKKSRRQGKKTRRWEKRVEGVERRVECGEIKGKSMSIRKGKKRRERLEPGEEMERLEYEKGKENNIVE